MQYKRIVERLQRFRELWSVPQINNAQKEILRPYCTNLHALYFPQRLFWTALLVCYLVMRPRCDLQRSFCVWSSFNTKESAVHTIWKRKTANKKNFPGFPYLVSHQCWDLRLSFPMTGLSQILHTTETIFFVLSTLHSKNLWLASSATPYASVLYSPPKCWANHHVLMWPVLDFFAWFGWIVVHEHLGSSRTRQN